MEHATVVGIDVSKDRLDVHVLPSEEAWAVRRDAEGLAELCRRLQVGTMSPMKKSGSFRFAAGCPHLDKNRGCRRPSTNDVGINARRGLQTESP